MNWLLAWFIDAPQVLTPQVAVACAYAALEDVEAVAGEPDPDCKECQGTGWIATGDGQGKTRCDCVWNSEPREPMSTD